MSLAASTSRAFPSVIALTFLSMTLLGCANMTHFSASHDWTEGNGAAQSAFIDAKQRAVTVVRIGDSTNAALRLCAEPSPDALSALAASSSVSFSKEQKASLGYSLALAESAGSIGLRTQSIQLMRDAMYRLCEGYLSNALTESAFETLHRRFQSSMVAILAIEQLTGVIRAPTVLLGGIANAGDPAQVADLTLKTESARAALRESETNSAAKAKEASAAKEALAKLEVEKTKLDQQKEPPLTPAQMARQSELGTLIPEAQKKDEVARLAAGDSEKSVAERRSAYESYDRARQAALAGGGGAKSTPDVKLPSESRVDPAAVASVSTAVSRIVTDALQLSFGREVCATVLLRPVSTTGTFENELATKCLDYLGATTESIRSEAKANANLTSSALKHAEALASLIATGKGDSEDIAAHQKYLDDLAKSIADIRRNGPQFFGYDRDEPRIELEDESKPK